ncbi:hypothetical protein YC2023_075195 [Brassica napus]
MFDVSFYFLYCIFTYYLFFLILYIYFFFIIFYFLNNNATCYLSEEFFSLMWTLYGASKSSFY